MKSLLKYLLLAAAPFAAGGAEARFTIPFDGTPEIIGKPGEKLPEAKIFSWGTRYVDGVSGKALSVRRHAYDQVTAVNISRLPVLSCTEGSVAFWYRPNPEDKGDGNNWLYFARGGNKILSYLIYFRDKGEFELSVCAPRQRQLFAKQKLTPGKWYHLAFTWSAKKGEVAFYVNGKRIAGKQKDEWIASDFKVSAPLSIWLGRAGSDRFQAKVGEGDYDEIKLYDGQLSPDEILTESIGGTSAQMSSVPAEKVVQNGKRVEVRFSAPFSRFSSAQPLMKFKSSGGEIQLSSFGSSGKLMIGGAAKNLESPYVFNHKLPLNIAVEAEGKQAKIFFDGVLQGTLELGKPWGTFVGLEAVPALKFHSVAPDALGVAALERKSSSALEKKLWSLNDAWKRSEGARERISLNGIWRVFPGENYTSAPVSREKQLYGRVPGSCRSTLFLRYVEKNGELSALPVKEIDKKVTAGWYQRTFTVPEEWKGKHIFLRFEDLNADYGKIMLNGKLIDAFRQDFKNALATPNERLVEITPLLKKENVLSIFTDRASRGSLLHDDAYITVNNVWLEANPSPVRLTGTLVLPSYRKSSAEFRTTVSNPSGVRGKAELVFRFRNGKDERTFRHSFVLSGEKLQRVKFTEAWKNPVLWSAENPQLYTQTLSLNVNGVPADTLPERQFGFREAWVENGEFRLNGLKTRYRMLTNPMVEHVYFTNPRATEQYISGLKYLNFDTVRFNPNMMKGEYPVNAREYLEACDRLGVYNLFPMPPYDDDEMSLYREGVEKFFEHYGQYTSIIMWYTDFNTCHYQRNQDPYYLNDTKYLPEKVIPRRRKAMTAERTIRALDSTREVFQHAGGNSGKIFTSMNYQSYGTPLQEQEDWPKVWSASHTQPLMVVESGFPYSFQFLYFDGPKENWLFAENASRFFGDGVYRAEKRARIRGEFFSKLSNPHLPPNYIRVSAEHYRRVLRAWRGYDVSALGDFTNLRNLFVDRGVYTWHNRFFWGVDRQVKVPGVRPDSARFGLPLVDFLAPTPLAELVRRELAPLRVFLAGKPAQFTNKDHAFTSGEAFEKSAVVINDRTTAQTLLLRWKFIVDGVPVEDGEKSVTVEPGGIEKISLNFTAPRVAKRTEAKIELEVFRENAVFDVDSMNLQIFPVRKTDFANVAPAALYDPQGRTAELLDKAGFPYVRVSTFAELMRHRLLIIGQNALGKHIPDFIKQLESSGELAMGYKILVFEQQPDANLGNFVFESPSYREAFVRRPDSVYLRGLTDADLRDWRGSSDTRPEKIVSVEETPHYPRSKWKIGNSGMVAGNVIRKPSNGSFHTIVDCGPNLMFSALMEARKQHGLLLFCQLDVTSRYGKDPAATLLVDNILQEFSVPFLPVNPLRTVYFGDAKNETRLQKLGVEYTKGRTVGDLDGVEAIVLGADPVAPQHRAAFVKELAKRTGKQHIICLPGAPLELLPVPLKLRKVSGFKAELPPSDPLFDGIAEADLYYRQQRSFDVVEGPEFLVATKPAFFAKLDCFPNLKMTRAGNGDAALVILTLAPDEFSDPFWNEEKVSRVWNSIFCNLGIRTGKDQKFFTNTKMRHNRITPKVEEIPIADSSLKLDPANSGTPADASGFRPYKLGTSWEKQGFRDVNPHYSYPAKTPSSLKVPYDGYAWIRAEVTVPESWRGRKIHLTGGPIDDADRTWFNGRLIGEMQLDKFPDAYALQRNYPIPESAIRFGEKNELLIQVFDRWGEGGVTGPLFLSLEPEHVRDESSPYIEKLNFYDVDAFHNW